MPQFKRAHVPKIIVGLMLLLVGWIVYRQVLWGSTPPVDISIIYAPEAEPFMPQVIEAFNQSFARGINPVTGESLAQNQRPIHVSGRSGSSGVVQQGIVNALLAPNNANVERPTLFSPSTSIWLTLANHAAGQEIFTLKTSPATALDAVVIAIWESRLKALQAKAGNQTIGWEELLAVLQAPQGWQAYGIPGRQTVYYGHTNPYVSSTGLATLLAEFYASVRYQSKATSAATLTLAQVNDAQVQQGVRAIEGMVKHYSERTTEFRDYIAQGPDYVDFVALQEDALLSINLGQAQFTPPEKLVALYPKEGTFWFDHPFAIPNTAWVSPEQRAAAGLFTDYVLSAEVQKLVLTLGLMRPVNPAVQLGYPYVAELGVEPARQRNTALTPPPADVIAAAQASWQYVKKQADILLLFDTSGSMQGDKLDKAKAAALQFVRQLAPQNRVAVATFNDTAQLVLPFAKLENAPDALNNAIGNLSTNGGTALYDGLLQAAATLQQEGDGRIRAIVLLSDGQDTASNHTLQEVLTLDRGANNPLLIFPVAYGSDADIGILNNIARMSATKVLSGAPEDIDQLFELLSSFF